MRTQLLFAMVFLCGAAAAQAQYWPAYPNVPYAQGYPAAYPMLPAQAPAWPNYLPPAPSVPMAEGPILDPNKKPLYAGDPPVKDQVWFSASYALGWIREMRTGTPLVTSGSTFDLAPGALGQPNTSVIYGDTVSFGAFSGVTAEAGAFLNEGKTCSVEARGFIIFPSRERFAIASDPTGNPLLARPIYDVFRQQEAVRLISANAGFVNGGVAIESESQMYGFEVNTKYHTYSHDCMQAGLLGGFRFLQLKEYLQIRDQTRPLVPGAASFLGIPAPADSLISDEDLFRTTNTFYGMQLGAQLGYQEPLYYINAYGKIGLGVTEQRTAISGSTTLTTPTTITSAQGAVFAQTSNIGGRRRYVLGFVPELGLSAGLSLTPNVRVTAGYSFLYWSAVSRPGDLIDRNVNTTQVPVSQFFGPTQGPVAPLSRISDSGFWLQTVNCGLELHF